VAISRAQHGQILLANVTSLRRSTEWGRLFDIIKELSPGSFVTPAEFFGTTPTAPIPETHAAAEAVQHQSDPAAQQALTLAALGLEEEDLHPAEEQGSRKRSLPKPRKGRSKSKKE